MFSFILLFAVGCVKTRGPVPTPTPKAPVIQLSNVNSLPLNFGDSTSFSWQIAGDGVTVSLNGKPFNATDSYNTGRLFADTTYKLTAKNLGGSVSDTVSYKVGDWTTSKYGFISHSYWMFDSVGYKTDTMPDFTMISRDEINEKLYDDMFYYDKNGTLTVRSKSGTQSTYTHPWRFLPGDTLGIGRSRLYIKYLSKTKMVLYQKSAVYNATTGITVPAVFKTIYKRDNQ